MINDYYDTLYGVDTPGVPHAILMRTTNTKSMPNIGLALPITGSQMRITQPPP